MSLRKKTLLIFLAAFILLMGAFLLTSYYFILQEAVALENKIMAQEMQRMYTALNDEADTLEMLVNDYGVWDDSFDFLEEPHQDFIQTNYLPVTFSNAKISFVYYLDKQGKVVYSQAYDVDNNTFVQEPKGMAAHLVANGPLLRFMDDHDGITGIIMLEQGPAFVASRPVVRSDYSGPSPGTLILGRYFNDMVLSGVRTDEDTLVSVHTLENGNLPAGVRQRLENGDHIVITSINSGTMAGYTYLKDIYGQPIGVLRVQGGRAIYQQGLYSMLYYLGILLVFFLVTGMVVGFINERIILRPLTKLNDCVDDIKAKGELSNRIKLKAQGELQNLVIAINSMLESLENAQEELSESEKRYKYLSYNDTLTGMYNRAYFESEMERINESLEDYAPVSIISMDVDGLKIVNDTFGHQAGDDILRRVAQILIRSTEEEDVLARVGGDEFCIILPKTSAKQALERRTAIFKRIDKQNKINSIHVLSMSIGVASTTGHEEESVYEIYKRADDDMFNYKLSQAESPKSKVIELLLAALSERDFIAQGHVERLVALSEKMAARIDLCDEMRRDLVLLAKVHDLGKVGIPDEILFKPGRLTEMEYIKMKEHATIGYNIANRSRELAHVAGLILHHHEFWNGKGYPAGLKGEEIPLTCRILGIIDAYDAMTNDRPYHQGISQEEAIIELRRCADSQFEPALVEEFIQVLYNKDGLVNHSETGHTR